VKIDRYTKAILTVIAIALVMIAARPWLAGLTTGIGPDAAEAQAAKWEHTLPKAWGKMVGFSNNNILLEDKEQTLRVVDLEGKAPEYPKIKVLVRWQ
jgi:hypothetical protein